MRKGEIEGRIDAQFYGANLDIQDFIKLRNFVKVRGGKRIPKGFSYSDDETDFWYLRVDDIDSSGNIKFQNLKFLSSEIFEILENYELKQDEVVISIAGTIGKITLLENAPSKRIILTENCAKLQIKNEYLLPKFLTIVLSLPFAQKQMSLSYIQTTIPKLGLERIYNLKIPDVPPIKVQAQIIEKFESAYNHKRAKETEAKQMLDGIDVYLLDKLGIETPAATETKTTFFTSSTKLSGGRFDPSFYQPNFQNLIDSIANHSHKRLREIVKFSSESWNQKDFFENTFPYIEISEIDLIAFGNSFRDETDTVEGVLRFQDAFMLDEIIEFHKEIYDIEMKIREVLSYILAYNFSHKDLFNCIEEFEGVDFGNDRIKKVAEHRQKVFNEFLENEIFHIIFTKYGLFKYPKATKVEKIYDFIKQSNSFDELRELMQQEKGITENINSYHKIFVNDLAANLQQIEDVRNEVMHNREVKESDTYNALAQKTGYKTAKERFDELIKNFWEQEKSHTVEDFRQIDFIIKTLLDNLIFETGGSTIAFADLDFEYREADNREDLKSQFLEIVNERLEIEDQAALEEMINDKINEIEELTDSKDEPENPFPGFSGRF